MLPADGRDASGVSVEETTTGTLNGPAPSAAIGMQAPFLSGTRLRGYVRKGAYQLVVLRGQPSHHSAKDDPSWLSAHALSSSLDREKSCCCIIILRGAVDTGGTLGEQVARSVDLSLLYLHVASMDPLSAVGAAASIITILEATRVVFTQLIDLTRTIYNYSEKSEKVVRQCTFDTDTINAITETIKRSPRLFQDDAERNSLEQVLYHLQLDLLRIKARIEPLRQVSVVRRLNFALQEKTLSELDRDVFNWSQRLYIRFSFLLLRIQAELYENGAAPSSLRRVPEILSQHLMRDIATKAKVLDHKALRRDMQVDRITLIGPPSTQMQASTAISVISASVIIEFRPYPLSADTRMVAELEQRVSQLAALFQHAKPSLMYTLSCHGYYIDQRNSRFGLIYKFPPSSPDYTRLDTLFESEPEPTCSLSMRFEIARRLAVAVAFVHGAGWVHKAIQTQRVLLFTRASSDPTSATCLGDAYLTGFQDARDVHGDSTVREADLSWKAKLYRHPDRHNSQDNAYFTTGHDIFALGVVLLELGLWSLLAADKYEALLRHARPHEYKLFLVTMAGTVDRRMGSLYQDVVKRCLEVDAGISEAQRTKLMSDVLIDLEQLAGVV